MLRHRFGCLGALCITLAVLASCREKTNPDSERVCSEGQALAASKYKGTALPPKTLALTFDDGPGLRTLELSQWLKSQNVPAAFFVNGRMCGGGAGSGAILQALVNDGHVIANHTQMHVDLTTITAAQIVTEVAQTDTIIAPFVPDGRFMFRPPFGAYNDATFSALDGSSMKKYVGPIDWDIGSQMGPQQATDWDCWSAKGTSVPAVLDVKTCGDLYLAEIRSVSRGIVLLHDPYFIDDDPKKGGTVDMVKYIVPILKAEGFTFVRVDMVPGIADALPPLTTPPPPATDGGTAADASSTAPTATSSSSPFDHRGDNSATVEGSSAVGGDSSQPCPPSPQVESHGSARTSEESGHLRNP